MSWSGAPQSFPSQWSLQLLGAMSASATALYTSGESFSPDWIGPPNDLRVKVDGLRNGWLGPHSSDVPPRFGQASWYLLSRFASLVAAGLLIVLAVSLWPERRYLLVARARVASERRIRAQHLGGQRSG